MSVSNYNKYLLMAAAATLIIMVVFTIELRYGADSIMETYTPTAASSQRREAVLQSDEISTRPHLTPSRYEIKTSTLDNESRHSSTVQRICEKLNTTEAMCDVIQRRKSEAPRTLYPIQLVSGSPGSGNDWILWLGAVYAYERTQEHLLGACEVYHGNGKNWLTRSESHGRYFTHCPFVKSHEPFFFKPSAKPKSYVLTVDRAAVILRHPFDSAFSEFKRIWVHKEIVTGLKKTGQKYKDVEDAKSQTNGIKLDLYFKGNLTPTNDTEWSKWYPIFIERWQNHAKFWLTKYERSLHVLIYNDFVSDTRNELSSLMSYMGYAYDNSSIHRHCCVLHHPFNKNLRRGSSVIDQYKEMLLEKDEPMKKQCLSAVREIQQILDNRWPGVYKIRRG